MNKNTVRTLFSLGLALAVASCGGDGSGIASPTGATLQPTVYTSQGRILNSCAFSPACSGNPYAPFSVIQDPMPVDGAVLSGVVRLQARGIDLANVELLPGTGYAPRLGVFAISQDKTTAWLDLDTRTLPNGPVSVRVSAFNVPAGQPGAVELIAMPGRTWNISNAALPAQGFSAALTAAPPDGASVSGVTRLELRGSGIANAELLPVPGYTPRFGQFNVSKDKTYAWLDLDTSALPDGIREVRISAFDVTAAQPNAREIVVMPPRRWDFRNGSDGSFSALLITAPAHGARVTGRITIEVQGAGLKNVELLPAEGYQPIRGDFVESHDGKSAYLDLNTAALPNGPIDVRVSAFSVPAGQPGGREAVVMPARRWIVRN